MLNRCVQVWQETIILELLHCFGETNVPIAMSSLKHVKIEISPISISSHQGQRHIHLNKCWLLLFGQLTQRFQLLCTWECRLLKKAIYQHNLQDSPRLLILCTQKLALSMTAMPFEELKLLINESNENHKFLFTRFFLSYLQILDIW